MKSQIFVLVVWLSLAVLVRKIEAQCSMTNPCLDQLGQGQPFVEPDQVSYDLRGWCIEMNVDIGVVKYGWLELRRRMYNGKITGPTWTVKRGDDITVSLRNHLSDKGNNLNRVINKQNFPNTTNLHTHGLHISSKDPQDNVLKRVEPGKNYQYRYQIHEENPIGTNWYHAHVHQSTMFQVHSGLSGMLIVQDDVTEMAATLEAASCPNNCDKDIQMVFQPILQYSNGDRGFGKLQGEIKDDPYFRHDHIITNTRDSLSKWLHKNLNFMTTNGQLQPVLTMTTGQMYRFRMVNAGGDAGLELFIAKTGNEATSACEIREIAIDGVYLDAPRRMHDGQSFLTPAARVDWLVKCNTAGDYTLRSFRRDSQRESIGVLTKYDGDLVTLRVTGAPVDPVQTFPRTLPPRPPFVSDLRDAKPSDIGGRFVIELNPNRQINRESWASGDNYRYKMEVGKIQEWHLLSTETKVSHPLHIHVNHFQVISYNNYTGGYGLRDDDTWALYNIDDLHTPCHYQRSGIIDVLEDTTQTDVLEYWGHDQRFKGDNGTLGYSRVGDWRDVLLVPPLANITIRFIPHEFTGDVIIHCHILAHEDAGMMMNTEIVEQGQSTKANVKSGSAYPGTCDKCDRYAFNNPKRLCDPDNATKPTISLFVIVASLLINHKLQVTN